ncbi:MAG: hypothetical protein VB042_09650 [Victivallaceae bacterium]|nr:hypothetical protein [Victivallaceae bacterium]
MSSKLTFRIVPWAVVAIVAAMVGIVTFLWLRTPPDCDWKAYEIRLDGHNVTWGCFTFNSGIPSEPQVRVEYLLPSHFNPQTTAMVFYAPFGNAQNSLKRPQIYKLATEKGMMVFTVAFNYDIEKKLPQEQRRTDMRSGWHEKIFDIQNILKRKLGMPHRKLFVFGDSSGAVMSQQMSRFFPDQIEAAAWISANNVVNYQSEVHPPVLAISTWGDSGLDATLKMVEQDRRQGGYSLFMIGPPSWPEKGYDCFHHGGHDWDYTLIREFIYGIADRRQHNNDVAVMPRDWKDSVLARGTLITVPSLAFKEFWERIPHDEILSLAANKANSNDGLLTLRPKNAHHIVFYLQPPSWGRELWLIDNLFFIFEHGSIAVSYPITDNVDGFQAQISSGLLALLRSSSLPRLPITIVCGGECAIPLAKALGGLPETDKSRIEKVIYLNPPNWVPLDKLLTFKMVEIWSNNAKYKTASSSGVFYRNENGDSFGHSYFKVLGEALCGAFK